MIGSADRILGAGTLRRNPASGNRSLDRSSCRIPPWHRREKSFRSNRSRRMHGIGDHVYPVLRCDRRDFWIKMWKFSLWENTEWLYTKVYGHFCLANDRGWVSISHKRNRSDSILRYGDETQEAWKPLLNMPPVLRGSSEWLAQTLNPNRFLLWLALFELYRIKCGDIGKITAIQNEAGENFEKGWGVCCLIENIWLSGIYWKTCIIFVKHRTRVERENNNRNE